MAASNLNPHYMLNFFFNDTATTEIYTLSLHDALPIFSAVGRVKLNMRLDLDAPDTVTTLRTEDIVAVGKTLVDLKDRKSTSLNSSHANISFAVFCLTKNTNTLARWPDWHPN